MLGELGSDVFDMTAENEESLRTILQNPNIIRIWHDSSNDADTLSLISNFDSH